MPDDDRQSLARAAAEGAREGVQEEVRAWGRVAKWGGLAGAVVGGVLGVVVFGPPGIGVGLLIGIPGGAGLAVVAYLGLSSLT